MADGDSWVKVVGDPTSAPWVTAAGCKVLLTPIQHLTAGSALDLLLPLVEHDRDLQVMLTIPPSPEMWHDVEPYVQSLGFVVMPWQQAIRTPIDLALTASFNGTHQLRGPVAVASHGVRLMKSRRSPWGTDVDTGYGLGQQVLARDGRIVPAALLLAHDEEVEVLRMVLPQAVPRAVVAGDPRFDRLVASASQRERYRRHLGVRDGQVLVLVTSTWSRYSLFGSERNLWARLVAELRPEEFRVVTTLHPNIWSMHGRRPVRGWFTDYLDAGYGLLPPERGWEAATVAADVVIGDHGSVTQYAASRGVPVLISTASQEDEHSDSVSALVRRFSRPLLAACPLDQQLRAALRQHDPDQYTEVTKRITTRPRESAAIIRRTLYSLLDLPEPARVPQISLAPAPRLIRWPPDPL